ncbi:hypothetical protein BDQ17DRAFT_647807 [Cyathus striatus]|nr:hypothetical protein BDQ17DRAFT_647807 [Cyathus striatus]
MISSSSTQAFARNCACLAGLISVIVDGILCAGKEYRYIWQQPWSRVKLLYLFSRYGAIVVQIVTCVMISSPSSLSDPHICYNWILFQHISFSSLYFVFELVLMLRVYALYKKSAHIATIFTLVSLLEIAFFVYNTVSVAPRLVLDEKCIITEAPTDVIVFGLVLLQNQGIIVGLTLWRYRHAIRDGWANIPVVKLVMRDGVWIFCAITAVLAATIPYSMFVENMGHVFFSLLITTVSVFTCRPILNMQSLIPTDQQNDIHIHDTEEGFQFTVSLTDSFVSYDDIDVSVVSLVGSANERGTVNEGTVG